MNWHKDLKFGNEAELAFMALYPDMLTRTDGRNGDLIRNDGVKIELKTERRSSTDTGNIFFEEFSNRDTARLGGPFRALEDGSGLFVVFFFGDKKVFVYNTGDVVKYLVDTRGTYKQLIIRNSKATGYAVPIDDIKHLEVKIETN